MATWNSIIDQVGDELELDSYQSGGADNGRTQHALDRTLQHMLKSYPFTWNMEATPISRATISGTSTYDITTTTKFLDIYAVLLDTGGTDGHPLIEKDVQWFTKHFPNLEYDATDKPRFYMRLGNYSLKLAPRPNAIYTLQIFHSLESLDISDFTVESTLPNKAYETLELGMLARLYRFLHEYEVARELKIDYVAGLRALIAEDKENPNQTFVKQEFNSIPAFSTDYWKNPFI